MTKATLNDMAAITEVLSTFKYDQTSAIPEVAQKAITLARHLQARAAQLQTPQERRQQHELERMMATETDKATLIQMTDQAFRTEQARRAAEQIIHILDVQGIPRFFSAVDRMMLRGFQSFGDYLPGVSIPLVKDKMRAETANVILPAEPEILRKHLAERRAHGLRMNVNYLGEALLGEGDAQRRLESYLAALQLPEIEVISVKVSTIYSQIMAIDHAHAVDVLSDRMELLYRAAARARFQREDGTRVPKFVYLDMEEYRDLDVTVDTFMNALSRKGLEEVNAGVALQAYLPDSADVQVRITEWAKERVAAGGAPVTIRIVKGANMEMERVEASLEVWPQAPYQAKIDTDANYKRMIEYGLRPENASAVRVGVASHNLFDIAYALVLTVERDVHDSVQFEMLEGMANHQRRALSELASNILLYAPATKQDDFVNAIGYLIRRLDENTGPDNFLRHTFKLEVDSDEWTHLAKDFARSVQRMPDVPQKPRRTQDRTQPMAPPGVQTGAYDFVNEPDTDFALPANRAWAQTILDEWHGRHGDAASRIPLFVAGELVDSDRRERESTDPSRPGVVIARYLEASIEDIDRAVACARRDPRGWRQRSPNQRRTTLMAVADELRRRRNDLMGAALADGGKLLTESDPEVSEAIDFVEYYARTANQLFERSSVSAKPKGVVVVVPPWNFPIAIPCGGIAAALAAGNTVILKPASHTVLVASVLVECFWAAGIPKEVLQCVPCSGATGGAHLVGSNDVDVVILTGSTDTALRMLDARPRMNLLAETGGKNATIVTAMSDREQAIKHVLQSAFGHTGQKCSATSLLILEAEVFHDPIFKETLVDAASSIRVGSAWSLSTRMGPLVHPPARELERGLKELEPGETWALMPKQLEDNACLYSPGIKWGVTPGSFTHTTEFFGPVLGVMCAESLDQAIAWVNATGYGLTSGIESLDPREQQHWRDSIRAGNLYVNRGTTGAIVHRQPFGGMGKSAFGPGIKAGGPNYVAQLMDFEDCGTEPVRADAPLMNRDLVALRKALVARHPTGNFPPDLRRLLRAFPSYEAAYQAEFVREHDDFRLVGQDNIRRYLPVGSVRIRIHPQDSAFEIFARTAAAKIAGCHSIISVPLEQTPPMVSLLEKLTEAWGASVEFVEETDAKLAEIISRRGTDRLRYAKPDRVPEIVLRSISDTGIYIASEPVSEEGRIELMWYLREQSISDDYHRYGNLGGRTHEERSAVL